MRDLTEQSNFDLNERTSNDLMNASNIRKIRFHVKCCVNRNRTLNETYGQVSRDWGHRPHVKHLVRKFYSELAALKIPTQGRNF